MIEKPVPDKYKIISVDSWPTICEDAYTSSAGEHESHAKSSSGVLESRQSSVREYGQVNEALFFEAHCEAYRSEHTQWEKLNDSHTTIASTHFLVADEIISLKNSLILTQSTAQTQADALYAKATADDNNALQASLAGNTAQAQQFIKDAKEAREKAVKVITEAQDYAKQQYSNGMESITNLENKLPDETPSTLIAKG